MKGYQDSLRGYGYATHIRYKFICQYCGYDGRSFSNWLQLTVDHILPISHGGEDDEDNLITVCQACNSFTSRMKFPEGLSKKEIIVMKKKWVKGRIKEYLEFYEDHVRDKQEK